MVDECIIIIIFDEKLYAHLLGSKEEIVPHLPYTKMQGGKKTGIASEKIT